MHKEIIYITLITLFLVALSMSLAVGGVYLLEKKMCKETAKVYGVDWDYSIWTSCVYNIDGKWISKSNYIEARLLKENNGS